MSFDQHKIVQRYPAKPITPVYFFLPSTCLWGRSSQTAHLPCHASTKQIQVEKSAGRFQLPNYRRVESPQGQHHPAFAFRRFLTIASSFVSSTWAQLLLGLRCLMLAWTIFLNCSRLSWCQNNITINIILLTVIQLPNSTSIFRLLWISWGLIFLFFFGGGRLYIHVCVYIYIKNWSICIMSVVETGGWGVLIACRV